MSDLTYFIRDTLTGYIKIGTSIDPQSRMKTLQTGCPGKLELVATTRIPEFRIHEKFKDACTRGEWFSPNPELLNYIEEKCNAQVDMKTVKIAAMAYPEAVESSSTDVISYTCRGNLLHSGQVRPDDEWEWYETGVARFLDEFVTDSHMDYDDEEDRIIDPDMDECGCEFCAWDAAIYAISDLNPSAVWGREKEPILVMGIPRKLFVDDVYCDCRKMWNIYSPLDVLGVSAYFLLINPDSTVADCITPYTLLGFRMRKWGQLDGPIEFTDMVQLPGDAKRFFDYKIEVVSKIESRAGLENLESICKESDAILIDRGDLSREVPLEKIVFAQSYILEQARAFSMPVYVATNLMETMIQNSKPTRAEVNDIVKTLNDGARGLVLAAETAIGKYPVECIRMMVRIVAVIPGAE